MTRKPHPQRASVRAFPYAASREEGSASDGAATEHADRVANFSTTAVQKTVHGHWLTLPKLRQRDDVPAVGRSAPRRLPGRLNLFQKAMLEWRDMHPYVAVHAARIAHPFDRDTLTRAIADTLSAAGLTGLELDHARGRYAWRGGAAEVHVDVVAPGDDWRATLARTFERQLNQGFARGGRLDPFRFFALEDGEGFFAGVAYDHFIAGGDSIIVLLNAIADRYAGKAAPAVPLARYPRTHWRLFARHPWQFVRGVGRFPAMAASCRSTIRPRYRSLADGYNAFTFFTLDPAEYGALRRASRSWGVTLNDALIALLLLAQDAQLPSRDRSKRRHHLAVGSIMNLREAHGEDVHRTFGQFLSSFRVAHPVPAGITLEALARGVHGATAHIKQERLYLTTLFAIGVDRALGRFQTQEQRMGVYAKSYPVGAGVSSLNVNALWRAADGGGAPPYVRGVPTGPTTPIAVAVTTSGDTLCAGVSYRTSAVSADAIARMESDIRSRIESLT